MSEHDLELDPDVCPVCGFRPRKLLPSDGVRALRVLPRRWRETLAYFAVDEDGERRIRQPLGVGPSALGHAALVAEAWHWATDQLEQLRTQDHPSLGDHGPPGRAGHGDTADTESVLRALADEALRLTDQAQRIQGHDWMRTGLRSGREVTALAVLRRAVHEGTHRLYETTRGLTRLHAAGAAEAPPRKWSCSPAA